MSILPFTSLPEPPHECVISSRSDHPSHATSTGTTLAGTTKVLHHAAHSCTGIRLVFDNSFRWNTSAEDSDQVITVNFAIMDKNGHIYPVYVDNINTVVTVPAGQTIITNPVYIPLQAGDPFYILTHYYVVLGSQLPVVPVYTSATVGAIDSVQYGVDNTSTGVVTNDASVPSVAVSVSAVIGMVGGTRTPGMLIVGDSIANGSYDYRQNTPEALGFFRRLLNRNYPFIHIASGGDTVQNFVNQYGTKRLRLAQYCNTALINYGTNDIYSSGRTFAQLSADMLKMWQVLSSLGLTCYQTTIFPQVTFTNLGAFCGSKGGTQTQKTGYLVKDQINAWLRDTSSSGARMQSGGCLTGVLDWESVLFSNGLWKVPNDQSYTGSVTSATSNSITDSSFPGAIHTVDNLYVLEVNGEYHQVNINSPATKISITDTFTVIPTAGMVYKLWSVYTVDGIHPYPMGNQLLSGIA